MSEMTIAEILAWAKDFTLGTATVVFIVQLWRGELMWRREHTDHVKLYERLLETQEESHQKQLEVQEESHKKREAELERSLDKAEKRGDEWLNLSLQQNKLVDKSLQVTATVTEKPPP